MAENGNKKGLDALSLGRTLVKSTLGPKVEGFKSEIVSGVEDFRSGVQEKVNEAKAADRVLVPFYVREDNKTVFFCEFPGVSEHEIGDVTFSPVEGNDKALTVSVSATLYTGALRTYKTTLPKEQYLPRETTVKFDSGLLEIAIPLASQEPKEFTVPVS